MHPSQAELTGDLADYIAEQLPDELRYADPDLKPAKAPGEIDRAVLERLKNALPFAAALRDDLLHDWFGRFITRYLAALVPAALDKPLDLATFRKQLDEGAQLLRHPWSRLAWYQHKSACTLYANGGAYPATPALAQALCEQRIHANQEDQCQRAQPAAGADQRCLIAGNHASAAEHTPMKLQDFHLEVADWSSLTSAARCSTCAKPCSSRAGSTRGTRTRRP